MFPAHIQTLTLDTRTYRHLAGGGGKMAQQVLSSLTVCRDLLSPGSDSGAQVKEAMLGCGVLHTHRLGGRTVILVDLPRAYVWMCAYLLRRWGTTSETSVRARTLRRSYDLGAEDGEKSKEHAASTEFVTASRE